MKRRPPQRRGGIYIAVLGAAMLVTVLGMTAMAAVAVERLTAEVAADSAAARYAAESGIDLAMLAIKSQSNWRSTKPNGAWYADVAIGGAKVSVEVTDPVDASLANRDTDTVLVKATATRGQARHITQTTLKVQGDPIDALKTAVHTQGSLHVDVGATLTVSGAPASSGGTLANEGTVKGNVECLLLLPVGTVTGTTTILSTGKTLPTGITTLYAGLASAFSANNNFTDHLLTPAACTVGGASVNPDGVYLLNATGDVTIKNIRLWGTLVIRGNGFRVRIDKNVILQRYRADYPVLVVDGDLEVTLDGSPLTEAVRNMNPPGSPYLGVTDADQSDTYPSKIEGLVYVKGAVTLTTATKITGCVLAGSTALSNAVLVQGTPEITWDPALLTNPPLGFMQNTRMTVVPGSWAQATTP